MLNTVERVRIRAGLTKPQVLRLLEAKPGRASLFNTSEDLIDPVFIARAQEIEKDYDVWKIQTLQRIAQADKANGGLLTPQVAAVALGISEFHLVHLRVLGQIEGTPVTQRNWAYTPDALRALVELNSTYVRSTMTKKRGPLSNAFLKWRVREKVAA